MKTKITLAALAVATLVATPVFAQQVPKSRQQQAAQAVVYPNAVIVDGKIVGADPDARIRSELLREHMLDSNGW